MRKMNKGKTVITLSILAVLLFVGLYFMEEPVVDGNVVQQTVKIGAVLPLTGKASYIGEPVLNGLLLASENVNSVELIVEDSATNAETAVSAANKLLSVDGAKILISSLTSVSNAIAPLAEANKVILFYSSTSRGIAKDREYVFDGMPDARKFCSQATEAALSRGIYDIGYLGDIEGGGSECELGIVDVIESAGKGTLVAKERFSIKDPDTRTMLVKLREKKPEGVIIYTYGKLFPGILKDMIGLGIDTKLIVPFNSGTLSGSAAAIEIASSAGLLDGAVGSDLNFDVSSTDPKVREFVAKYEARFGVAPNGYAAYAYTNMGIIIKAVGQCGSDTECLKGAFMSMNYDGVTGYTTFDQDGVAVLPVNSIEYVDGRWR